MPVLAAPRVPLMQAALKLGWNYNRTRDGILCGHLRGEQDDRGRWYVDAESLASAIAARSTTVGTASATHP